MKFTAFTRRIFALFLAHSAFLSAQEIKSIDLSLESQRIELRHPAAPPSDCEPGKGCGGGYGGVSVTDGGPDQRDQHALGVYLLRVAPTDIDPAKPFEAEFRVLNTGLAAINLPVSPHLSDLQPADESMAFSYFSLALVVHLEGPQGNTPPVGFVELYGSTDHEGTMLALRPGEWISVKANVKLGSWPEQVSTRFRGEFWLRRKTFHPHPGGEFTEIQNLYPNKTQTPAIPVHLLHPASSSGQNH
jgi:hypothetical protein